MLKNTAYFVAGAVTWTCVCFSISHATGRLKRVYDFALHDIENNK